MLSITNPNSIFFHRFFIQFIDPATTHGVVAFSLLGAVLEIVRLTWMTFLLLTGATIARWLGTCKSMIKLGNYLTGFLFIGFAARLAVAQN